MKPKGGNVRPVTHKSSKVQGLVAAFEGRELDARYLGYFDCFNRQLFYEAHEVLEDLWLLDRRGADGDFYKGLIQLAGAFVHLQKGRLQPAIALLRLTRANLMRYPAFHHQLDLAEVLRLTDRWQSRLSAALADQAAARSWDYPKLQLAGQQF